MAEKLSDQDVRMIRALTQHLPVSRAGLPLESLEEMMHRVAREEVASLSALVLRRVQDAELTRSNEHNLAEAAIHHELAQIFGEALSDFSGHTKGEEPGE